MSEVEIWFDVVCPYAYLASTQIESVAARAGAKVRWEPMLLGGLFRAMGQVDDPDRTMSEPKRLHTARDLERWSEHFGVPLVRPASHPRRTVVAMRAICAANERDRATAIHALFAAYWARGEDVSDPTVVRDALIAAGLDGALLVASTHDAAIKDDLRARTDRAMRKGVFGVPTMFVGEEMFWGQDRLDWVERALAP